MGKHGGGGCRAQGRDRGIQAAVESEWKRPRVDRDWRQSSEGEESEGWVGEAEERKSEGQHHRIAVLFTTLPGSPSAFLSLPVSAPTSLILGD